MQKEKVVVTGGAGFIGSNLVDELVRLDRYNVHVVDNLVGGKRENVNSKAIFHEIDTTHFAGIVPILQGARYVFHLAALPRVQYSIEHPQETHEVNVNGLVNVLIAAREANVKKVVYSASSAAYGEQNTMPLKEDMIVRPKSPYGLQKYIGELYVRLWSEVYNLPTVSLRYFNVYGPRYNPEGPYALVIGKFLQQRILGQPLTITGSGEQTRDFTHVYDVVRANILAAESEKVGGGEVINIGAGRNTSINEVARLIGGSVVHVDARLEPRDTRADNTRAQELLGWKPAISLEEGLSTLKKEVGI